MDISALTKAISEFASQPSQDINPDDKMALLSATEKLRDAVEGPFDQLVRIMFSPYNAAALRVGVDMEVFDTAAKKGGPITTKELAEPKKAEPAFVKRIMRNLTGQGLFKQEEADVWIPQIKAMAYATPSPLNAAVIHLAGGPKAALQSFDYFNTTGYANPPDSFHGLWQHGNNSNGESYWDWLAKNPRDHEAFNITMRAQKMARNEEWFEYFPVEAKLALSEEDSSSRVTLVDVGGGWGHDIKLFHDKFPNLPGKLVLEDLPSVIASAEDLPESIITLGHSFLDAQPDVVKHAKAYHLRMIFHDWSDKESKIILRNLKDVMAPDSLLLIDEHVLPETGVTLFESWLDLHMMSLLGALERTEKQWRELIEGEGLEVKKIWVGDRAGMLNNRLIEVGFKN